MDFDGKVKFLRSLPQFKVISISEIRAIAFAAQDAGEIFLGKIGSQGLYINRKDAGKIIREYPDLEAKFK